MVTPFIPHNKYHRWQLHSTRTLVQYSDQETWWGLNSIWLMSEEQIANPKVHLVVANV